MVDITKRRPKDATISQEWAELCTKDLYNSLLVVLDLILALSGLPGAVTEKDLEAILVAAFAVDNFFCWMVFMQKKKCGNIFRDFKEICSNDVGSRGLNGSVVLAGVSAGRASPPCVPWLGGQINPEIFSKIYKIPVNPSLQIVLGG